MSCHLCRYILFSCSCTVSRVANTTLTSNAIVWTSHFCSLSSHHISEACKVSKEEYEGVSWIVYWICQVPYWWNSQERSYLGIPKKKKTTLQSKSSGFAFLETQGCGNLSLSLHSNPGEGGVMMLGNTWMNSLFPNFQALPAPVKMWPVLVKSTDTSQGLSLSPFSSALSSTWQSSETSHERSCKRF